jgi:hypothetical protein
MKDKKGVLLSIALLSLLLNAFLLGLLCTGPRGRPFPHPGGHFQHLQQAANHLDSPYREKALAILDSKKPLIDADEKKLSGNFSSITDTLTAPRFDPSRLKAANASIESADAALKTDMTDLMVGIASALPDAQRIRFFKDAAPPHPPGPGLPPP